MSEWHLLILAPLTIYGFLVFYDRHVAPRIRRLVYWLARVPPPERREEPR